MTILSTKVFGGEIPRIPADKLPANNAQEAVNCNFAYGELRPTKGTFLLRNLANAAKALFSLEGVRFASWTNRTKAWRGPVIDDQFSRFYYTAENGGFRVAQHTLLGTNGGEPATNYAVGVPSVAAAPTYVLEDRTTLPDYPNASVRLYSYYEQNGARFEETQISNFTTVKAFREYTFTAAAPVNTTPTGSAANTVTITSLSWQQNTGTITDPAYVTNTQSYNPAVTATISSSDTVIVDATTYVSVTSITPQGQAPTTPGAILEGRNTQVGASTPETARLGVRLEVVDTVKNATLFTLSTTDGGTSTRSEVVPGGVDATLSKNGTTANAWRLVLNYGVLSTRAYVVTMVNNWNEESKPSPPVLVSPTYLQSVKLTFAPPSFTGYVPCTRFRMYRSTGTGDYLSLTTTPQFFSGTSVTYTDAASTITQTDAILESTGWDLPPTNLRGLTLLPNGFFAAFNGNTLYFSEPYRPWAWPYAMTFPVNLVGMRSIESSLVVTTLTYPFMVSGVHPDAMTQAQLSTSQAGVSDHGMCVVGNTVAYISNDGIAVIDGYNVDLSLSQKFWTREVWRQQFGTVLSQLELAYHDGAVVCGASTAGKMWELRIDAEGGGNLSKLDSTTRADALYVLPASDQLYLMQGTGLYQYKGGSDVTYTWHSKEFILPKPINFGAGYINTTGPVTLTLYADGVQWGSPMTFTAPSYFRVASGSKSLRWSYKLSGTGIVKEISIAETMSELRDV